MTPTPEAIADLAGAYYALSWAYRRRSLWEYRHTSMKSERTWLYAHEHDAGTWLSRIQEFARTGKYRKVPRWVRQDQAFELDSEGNWVLYEMTPEYIKGHLVGSVVDVVEAHPFGTCPKCSSSVLR